MSEQQSKHYRDRYDAVTRGFDGMKIESIEALVRKYQAESFEARVSSFCCLQYLKHSNRYRENSRYKDATFSEYIESVYGIRYESFSDMRTAIIYHYDEAGKYGPGTIAEIMRKCGKGKVKMVISEIEAAAKRRGGVTHAVIKNVIRQHEKPKPAAPVKLPEIDYREMSENLRASIREKDEELATLRAQVKRQIEAIGRLKDKCAALKTENERLRQEVEQLRNGAGRVSGYDVDTNAAQEMRA